MIKAYGVGAQTQERQNTTHREGPAIEPQPGDTRVGREPSKEQVVVEVVAVFRRGRTEAQSLKEDRKSASAAARARQLQSTRCCLAEARIGQAHTRSAHGAKAQANDREHCSAKP